MTDIPVPTLDQITGRTVMEKMRTLAKSFIEFANEIKDNAYTEEEVREYVTSVLLNYYTKEEVDEAISSIDLSDFYTKSETDGMLALKRNIADSYTKSETDGMLTLKRNISDSYDKTEIDAKDTVLGNRIDSKQDILIPVAPIEIDENNNIFVDNQKVLINGKDHAPYFKIRSNLSGQELRIVYDYSTNSNYITLHSNGVLFRKTNGSDNSYVTRGGISITDHTSISLPVISLSANTGGSGTSSTKIREYVCVRDSSTNLWCLSGLISAPTSTAGKANGLFLRYGNSGETMILGTLLMANRVFTTFSNGIKITSNSVDIISNGIESPIATVKDFPTGKNLTDTVTFQDLVDLGLIKAPTS